MKLNKKRSKILKALNKIPNKEFQHLSMASLCYMLGVKFNDCCFNLTGLKKVPITMSLLGESSCRVLNKVQQMFKESILLNNLEQLNKYVFREWRARKILKVVAGFASIDNIGMLQINHASIVRDASDPIFGKINVLQSWKKSKHTMKLNHLSLNTNNLTVTFHRL